MNLLKVFRYVMIVMLDWNLPHEGLRSLVCGTYNDAEELGTHFVRFQGRESLSAICDGAATSVCCLTITTSVFLVFFYKFGCPGLWAVWTFYFYMCPLYPMWWGYHLPLQVLESISIASCTARVLWWVSCWNKVIRHMDGAFCFQILFLISFYPLVWVVSTIDCKHHNQLNAVNFCVVWTVPEKHVGWRPLVMSAFPLCISKFQEFVYNVSSRTTMQLSSEGVGQNLGGVWPVVTHLTVVGMSQQSCSRCGISFVNLIMTWF
jgi:hypothetical protein